MRGESTQREREKERLWKYPPTKIKKSLFTALLHFFALLPLFFFFFGWHKTNCLIYDFTLRAVIIIFLFLPIVWISKVLTYDYLFWFRSPKILWKYGFHILSLPISELCSYLIQYQLINGHLEKLIKRVGNTVNSISYNCIIAVIAILYETLDII